MDLGDARNVLAQLKSPFKAYEKMDEFLEYVASVEGSIGERSAKIAELAAQITELDKVRVEKLDLIRAESEKALEDRRKALTDAETKLKSDFDVLQKNFTAKSIKLQSEIAGLEAQRYTLGITVSNLQDEATKARAQNAELRASLAQEVVDLTHQRDDLRTQINLLISRLKGLV